MESVAMKDGDDSPDDRVNAVKHDELAARYRGKRATKYDAQRKDQPEWKTEHRTVQECLSKLDVGRGTKVLDVPVGTGRFFSLYAEFGCSVIAIDISQDMLQLAKEAAHSQGIDEVSFRIGDIAGLDLQEGSVDVTICLRLANLLEWPDFKRAVSEISRVTRKYVLIGVQLSEKPLPLSLLRRRAAASRVTQPHGASAVHRHFRRNKLKVLEKVPIAASASVPYYLFVLERSAHA